MAFMTLHEAAFEEGKQEERVKIIDKFTKALIRKSNGRLTYDQAKKETLDMLESIKD